MKQNVISGDLLQILSDYLRNRKQRVILNGPNSSWINVHAGVPQGSILGSLLFLIYSNDLADDLSSNVKLFADDASLFSVVHDVNAAARELNDDLKKMNKWAFQWKMSFNPGPSKQASVTLDVKLTFDEHLSNVLNKDNKTIGLLRKLQNLLSRQH